MSLARPSRSLVALLTAVLLLLCQTAFAAKACAHVLVQSADGAVSAPCHEAGGDTAPGSPFAPVSVSVCESTKAVGDSTKLLIYALADLPATPVVYSEAAVRVRPSDAPRIVHAVCHSPPLDILHCRLLN